MNIIQTIDIFGNPNPSIFIENEEFRPVRKFGIIIPGYYISIDARVWSTKSHKFLTPWIGKEDSDCGTRMEITFQCPANLFPDYLYTKRHDCSSVKVPMALHRAVAEAWKPIDENPPETLKSTWNEVPEEWRQWVRDTNIIDHRDDDPFNNPVSNLNYVTPKENAFFRKRRSKK